MVKLLLEMFGVSYIPVESLPQQERIRLLESVLDLAGFEKIGLEEAGGERLAEVDVPRPLESLGFDRSPAGQPLNQMS